MKRLRPDRAGTPAHPQSAGIVALSEHSIRAAGACLGRPTNTALPAASWSTEVPQGPYPGGATVVFTRYSPEGRAVRVEPLSEDAALRAGKTRPVRDTGSSTPPRSRRRERRRPRVRSGYPRSRYSPGKLALAGCRRRRRAERGYRCCCHRARRRPGDQEPPLRIDRRVDPVDRAGRRHLEFGTTGTGGPGGPAQTLPTPATTRSKQRLPGRERPGAPGEIGTLTAASTRRRDAGTGDFTAYGLGLVKPRQLRALVDGRRACALLSANAHIPNLPPAPRGRVPHHVFGPDVRDRAHPDLLRDDLVPLRVRGHLGRAAGLGAGRIRPAPAPRPRPAFARQGGGADAALRGGHPRLPLADRRLPVPPEPAAVLLRDLAGALPAGGQRAVHGVRAATARPRAGCTSPTSSAPPPARWR